MGAVNSVIQTALSKNILEIVEDSRLDLAPDLPHDQIKERFSDFLELLVKWNKKINLTSEKTAEEIL